MRVLDSISQSCKVPGRLAGATFCLFALATALATQAPPSLVVKRLYVEPFTLKNGGVKLREDLILELRKLPRVSVVTDRSSADAILAGEGEIWIKGYRSLNPRSGRQPSNGTPVFTGFLSVELKDAKGDTVWSYLVTPNSGSEDVSKDLCKQIVKHLAAALRQG